MIAVSSELRAARVTSSTETANVHVGGAGVAAPPMNGDFWSFLDGCLSADNLGNSAKFEPPASGGKRQHYDLTAPVDGTVPGNVPQQPVPGLSLTLVDSSKGNADDGTGGALAEAPSQPHSQPPLDTTELKTDSGKDPQMAGPLPELAFGARLVSLEPAASSTAAPTPRLGSSAPTEISTSCKELGSETAPLPSVGTSVGLASPRDARDAGNAPPELGRAGRQSPESPAIARTTSSQDPEGGHGGLADAKPEVPVRTGGTAKAAASGSPQAAIDGPAPAGRPDVEVAASVPAAPALGSTPSPTAQPGLARPAEMEPIEPPTPPISHDVSLHLGDGETSVDIRMAERAGEIRVTVHTPDRDLAGSLRTDLPDLVGKLRQSGFQAETWRPAAVAQPESERRTGSDGSPSQQYSPGARKDGRQQQQQQQSNNKSRWAGEWKSSLDPAQEPRT